MDVEIWGSDKIFWSYVDFDLEISAKSLHELKILLQIMMKWKKRKEAVMKATFSKTSTTHKVITLMLVQSIKKKLKKKPTRAEL